MVGRTDGCAVGCREGDADGCDVGCVDGWQLGCIDGCLVGLLEGWEVGSAVGIQVGLVTLGLYVGAVVGRYVPYTICILPPQLLPWFQAQQHISSKL